MKRKYFIILCFFLLCFFINTEKVFANNGLYSNSNGAYETQVAKDMLKNTNPLSPNVDIVTAKIESEDKPLDNYRPNFKKDEDWNPWGNDEIAGTINAFTTFIFDINKIIVQITDYSLEHLYSLDVIDDFAGKIAEMVNILYMSLSTNLLAIFFVIAMVNIYFLMAVKGDIGEFFKRFALLCIVIGVGSGVLSNVEPIIVKTNAIGKSVNTALLNGSQFSQSGGLFNEENGINNVRNRYFDTTVLRPYLLMNYNSVDEAALTKKDKNRINNLLELKNTKKNEKDIEKELTKEVETYKNSAILQTNVMKQLAISIITLVTTIIYSLIFLGVSLLKLILSAFSLLLVIFCVFSFMVSFLPKMEYSMFRAFKTTFGYIILSSCVTFVFVLFTLVQQIVDMFIPPNTLASYFLNIISIFATLYVLFIKRDKILSFITNGNVTFNPSTIGGNVSEMAYNNYKQRREQNKKEQERKRVKQEPQPTKAPEKESVKRSKQSKRNNELNENKQVASSPTRTMQNDSSENNKKIQQDNQGYHVASNDYNERQSYKDSSEDNKKIQQDNQGYQAVHDNNIERQSQSDSDVQKQTNFDVPEYKGNQSEVNRTEQNFDDHNVRNDESVGRNSDDKVIERTEQKADTRYSNQQSPDYHTHSENNDRTVQSSSYSNASNENISRQNESNRHEYQPGSNEKIERPSRTVTDNNEKSVETNDSGRMNRVSRLNDEQKERNKSYE
ncbi:CD3337/EF1877 family mobilome membrane protein [Macrococcoides canis]|uniref:CD3337/EF1877 family mobilome membrane protein n=1 Tax=Macrococcoides canis TaxID=1855823 RepID=UPI0022B8D41A|nr:hypothetical protein [Macrococcus canis]WBF53988.1 hypothetical protein LL975_12200 [Macrococcus canis]